jgi:hypothetical protein
MSQTESKAICRRHLLTMAGVSARVTLLAGRSLQARTSFESIRQINAGVLNVGYVEVGHRNGPAVLLLHGWPYDIHSYVDGCYPKSVISVRPGGERAHSSDIWRR